MRNIFLTFVLLFNTHISAKMYETKKLAASGVTMSHGMYYCRALKLYLPPYDNRPDVEACAYATQAKEICQSNLNTRWTSGRCFCPELNEYLGVNQRQGDNLVRLSMKDEDALETLSELAEEIKTCRPFTPRAMPFGRSVYLEPGAGFYTVKKIKDNFEWDNRDDMPGEQGNPNLGPIIASVLKIPVGFSYKNQLPIVPTFETLSEQLKKLNCDVGFFQTDGALSGRQYLQGFIEGQLPIARIKASLDATFLLHDMNFHVMGWMLMPKSIRQLAQKQTYYLLDFIDDFAARYPEKMQYPQFKLMMQKLVEAQIEQIDLATGNFTQKLARLLKHESSLYSFINRLSHMEPSDRLALHSVIMALTDRESGICERRSVKSFLEVRKGDYILGFDADELGDITFFHKAIDDYISRKAGLLEFVEDLAIDSYENLQDRSAVELLIERILELEKLRPAECALL